MMASGSLLRVAAEVVLYEHPGGAILEHVGQDGARNWAARRSLVIRQIKAIQDVAQ
jgi:hypothetical protein